MTWFSLLGPSVLLLLVNLSNNPLVRCPEFRISGSLSRNVPSQIQKTRPSFVVRKWFPRGKMIRCLRSASSKSIATDGWMPRPRGPVSCTLCSQIRANIACELGTKGPPRLQIGRMEKNIADWPRECLDIFPYLRHSFLSKSVSLDKGKREQKSAADNGSATASCISACLLLTTEKLLTSFQERIFYCDSCHCTRKMPVLIERVINKILNSEELINFFVAKIKDGLIEQLELEMTTY